LKPQKAEKSTSVYFWLDISPAERPRDSTREDSNLKNVFLNDLGFHENIQGDVLACGEESAKDPLVTELVPFIGEFISDPEHLIKLVDWA